MKENKSLKEIIQRRNLKRVPFDITLAKKIVKGEIEGAKIVTGLYYPVRILCFDLKSIFPIVAAVMRENGTEEVQIFTNEGAFFKDLCSSFSFVEKDLFLLIPKFYADYLNFIPKKGQACLVRNFKKEIWQIRVCSGTNSKNEISFYGACDNFYLWNEYIPLTEKTEVLVGTSKSLKELYKK